MEKLMRQNTHARKVMSSKEFYILETNSKADQFKQYPPG